MKERGILFNGDMVRAIMSGAKTQTRRPMKPQPVVHGTDDGILNRLFKSGGFKCPYGVPGDRLWVRETWQEITVDLGLGVHNYYYYRATDKMSNTYDKWRPAIHMPRCAARLLLDVIDIRVELACDISQDDAKAEGFNGRAEFLDEWNKIYGNRNLWAWVIKFRRVK